MPIGYGIQTTKKTSSSVSSLYYCNIKSFTVSRYQTGCYPVWSTLGFPAMTGNDPVLEVRLD